MLGREDVVPHVVRLTLNLNQSAALVDKAKSAGLNDEVLLFLDGRVVLDLVGDEDLTAPDFTDYITVNHALAHVRCFDVICVLAELREPSRVSQ